ncbi:hypothetical protein VM1G_09449 [Cytospora mali]|uniref:N-acetyltransferase domain-containing protein n=1 Tax=Cytospora mali TaxID=578113 RepID=A0A194WCZ7_CYTMA|nr:hypothetical protein VM1G_09449 [Valsa mali]
MSPPLPPITFRKATPADIPALNTLIGSAYRGETSRQGWTTEADFITSDRIDAAGLLAKLSDPDGAILVAAHPDSPADPLACCEVLRYPGPGDLAYFGLFAVNPGLQNGGVGRRVLGEAERYAREVLGVGRMEMTVVWLREALIAWYVRRGYVVLEGEKRPFPYEESPSGIVLRDDLYFVVLRKDLV